MVAVPSFVSRNARRGLKLLEFAGDGLKPATVREARQMAAGSISVDKVRRMAAWLARHKVDLESPDADAYLDGTKDRPTPGQVAWLLWGGDIERARQDRAGRWASKKRDELIASGELSKELNMDKMYGREMKDDDEEGGEYGPEYDPLQSLFNAYMAAVRMGPSAEALLKPILSIVDKLRPMYGPTEAGEEPMEEMMSRPMMKGHGDYTNPLQCLLHTYLGLLWYPERSDLRALVMDLIHQAEGIVYPSGDETTSEDGMEGNMGNRDVMARADDRTERTPVQRVIREENGQWCVYSEATGRSFGCYTNRTAAQERLDQIERFSSARLVSATLKELVEWHEDCHRSVDVTPATKLLHDLIEDTMESRGHARPYDITFDDKIDMLVNKNVSVISKADEQRYTLGPWYVPNMEDAHGEFTDEDTLQRSLWDWVRAGDRTIYLQHSDKPAGEMVEIMTIPFPIEAALSVPNQGTTKYAFPANTPFMGTVWEPWAWELVKAGKLRGYSIGGKARRMEADLPEMATIVV